MRDTLLACDKLTKHYNGNAVLDNLTLQARRGEVIGLLGLNGAGKTTLLETLVGYSLPDAGTAWICGQDALCLDAATRRRISFVPQRDELLDTMTPPQYLALIASFYPNWNDEFIKRLLRDWQVPHTQRINTLSIGQRHKLALIAALGNAPELLILDEPVASLDPLARRQFLTELVEIASHQQTTIVFSTHIVSDLERVATRVWLLREGHLILDAELDDIKEQMVRITVDSSIVLPPVVSTKVLRQRESNSNRILLCRHWNEALQALMERDLGAEVLIEHLSLEDIFLELHA
ncbi:MAG: ABC transporter ATP-binding protein [Pseudomonadales bacterium]|nr:ABC transporter ATP-binding protein [Pseudomonadales bacterium]